MRNFKVLLAAFLFLQTFCLMQFSVTMNHARDMGDHCPVEHCLAHGGEDSPALNTFNPPDPVDRAASFEDHAYLTYAEPKLFLKSPRELSSFLLQTQNIVLRL